MEYEFHDIANVFPMMADDELDGLVADIREHGLRDPITLYEGKVLDGRNRYVACGMAGAERRFVQFDGDDPVAFVISHNLRRRNLDATQLAVVAHDLLPMAEAEARKRQVIGGAEKSASVGNIAHTSRARDEVAGQVGVSSRYVQDVKRIARDAPELIAPMRAGTMTVPEAKRELAQRPQASRPEPRRAEWIAVDDWNNMPADERASALATANTSGAKFNEVNDNIEWAGWSWNPITGCLHNCDYCYARDIANRFYPQGFAPSFIPSRLSAPSNTKPGDTLAGRNVFVCSMADLFGKWVPSEWIESVLDRVRDNPQWTFLFLTKFPIRMAEFTYPPNAWLGTSVDRQWAVERAEKAFRAIKASGFDGVCWLSCEPMLERLTFTGLDMFDWVVMGGASKSTQTTEHFPPFDDIVHLYTQARDTGCRVYMKTNLLGDGTRVREYPGEVTA